MSAATSASSALMHSTDAPRVTIHDDYDLWSTFIRPGFEQRLPLRQLTVRNRTGTTQQIERLPLQLQLRSSTPPTAASVAAIAAAAAAAASSSASASAGGNSSPHRSPRSVAGAGAGAGAAAGASPPLLSIANVNSSAGLSWYKQSYVTIIIVKSENFELYRSSHRPALQELIDSVRFAAAAAANAAAATAAAAVSNPIAVTSTSPPSTGTGTGSAAASPNSIAGPPNTPKSGFGAATTTTTAVAGASAIDSKAASIVAARGSSPFVPELAPQEILLLFVPTSLNKLNKTTKKIWDRMRDDFPRESLCRLDLFDAEAALTPALASPIAAQALPPTAGGAAAARSIAGKTVGAVAAAGTSTPPVSSVTITGASPLQLQWDELIKTVSKLLLKAFETRSDLFEQEIRRLQLMRRSVQWNLHHFFLLKESYALANEHMQLSEEALRHYDELSAFVQSDESFSASHATAAATAITPEALSACMPGHVFDACSKPFRRLIGRVAHSGPSVFAGNVPATTPTPTPVSPPLPPTSSGAAPPPLPDSTAAAAAITVSPRGTMPVASAPAPAATPSAPAPAISDLELRRYLFARQCALLFKLHRPSEVAKRSADFIATICSLMEQRTAAVSAAPESGVAGASGTSVAAMILGWVLGAVVDVCYVCERRIAHNYDRALSAIKHRAGAAAAGDPHHAASASMSEVSLAGSGSAGPSSRALQSSSAAAAAAAVDTSKAALRHSHAEEIRDFNLLKAELYQFVLGKMKHFGCNTRAAAAARTANSTAVGSTYLSFEIPRAWRKPFRHTIDSVAAAITDADAPAVLSSSGASSTLSGPFFTGIDLEQLERDRDRTNNTTNTTSPASPPPAAASGSESAPGAAPAGSGADRSRLQLLDKLKDAPSSSRRRSDSASAGEYAFTRAYAIRRDRFLLACESELLYRDVFLECCEGTTAALLVAERLRLIAHVRTLQAYTYARQQRWDRALQWFGADCDRFRRDRWLDLYFPSLVMVALSQYNSARYAEFILSALTLLTSPRVNSLVLPPPLLPNASASAANAARVATAAAANSLSSTIIEPLSVYAHLMDVLMNKLQPPQVAAAVGLDTNTPINPNSPPPAHAPAAAAATNQPAAAPIVEFDLDSLLTIDSVTVRPILHTRPLRVDVQLEAWCAFPAPIRIHHFTIDVRIRPYNEPTAAPARATAAMPTGPIAKPRLASLLPPPSPTPTIRLADFLSTAAATSAGDNKMPTDAASAGVAATSPAPSAADVGTTKSALSLFERSAITDDEPAFDVHFSTRELMLLPGWNTIYLSAVVDLEAASAAPSPPQQQQTATPASNPASDSADSTSAAAADVSYSRLAKLYDGVYDAVYNEPEPLLSAPPPPPSSHHHSHQHHGSSHKSAAKEKESSSSSSSSSSSRSSGVTASSRNPAHQSSSVSSTAGSSSASGSASRHHRNAGSSSGAVPAASSVSSPPPLAPGASSGNKNTAGVKSPPSSGGGSSKPPLASSAATASTASSPGVKSPALKPSGSSSASKPSVLPSSSKQSAALQSPTLTASKPATAQSPAAQPATSRPTHAQALALQSRELRCALSVLRVTAIVGSTGALLLTYRYLSYLTHRTRFASNALPQPATVPCAGLPPFPLPAHIRAVYDAVSTAATATVAPVTPKSGGESLETKQPIAGGSDSPALLTSSIGVSLFSSSVRELHAAAARRVAALHTIHSLWLSPTRVAACPTPLPVSAVAVAGGADVSVEVVIPRRTPLLIGQQTSVYVQVRVRTNGRTALASGVVSVISPTGLEIGDRTPTATGAGTGDTIPIKLVRRPYHSQSPKSTPISVVASSPPVSVAPQAASVAPPACVHSIVSLDRRTGAIAFGDCPANTELVFYVPVCAPPHAVLLAKQQKAALASTDLTTAPATPTPATPIAAPFLSRQTSVATAVPTAPVVSRHAIAHQFMARVSGVRLLPNDVLSEIDRTSNPTANDSLTVAASAPTPLSIRRVSSDASAGLSSGSGLGSAIGWTAVHRIAYCRIVSLRFVEPISMHAFVERLRGERLFLQVLCRVRYNDISRSELEKAIRASLLPTQRSNLNSSLSPISLPSALSGSLLLAGYSIDIPRPFVLTADPNRKHSEAAKLRNRQHYSYVFEVHEQSTPAQPPQLQQQTSVEAAGDTPTQTAGTAPASPSPLPSPLAPVRSASPAIPSASSISAPNEGNSNDAATNGGGGGGGGGGDADAVLSGSAIRKGPPPPIVTSFSPALRAAAGGAVANGPTPFALTPQFHVNPALASARGGSGVGASEIGRFALSCFFCPNRRRRQRRQRDDSGSDSDSDRDTDPDRGDASDSDAGSDDNGVDDSDGDDGGADESKLSPARVCLSWPIDLRPFSAGANASAGTASEFHIELSFPAHAFSGEFIPFTIQIAHTDSPAGAAKRRAELQQRAKLSQPPAGTAVVPSRSVSVSAANRLESKTVAVAAVTAVAANSNLSLMYELHIDPGVWLLSGKPKAVFELTPGQSVSFVCKLLPVAAGYLPIPTVDLRQAKTIVVPVITPAAAAALSAAPPRVNAGGGTGTGASVMQQLMSSATPGSTNPVTTTFLTYDRVHSSRVVSRCAAQHIYVYPVQTSLSSATPIA